MACIKSAPRSALVAFAPNSAYLAAGTMAGAVDLSFSSSANLEIFKLDFVSDDAELPAAGSCAAGERFNRLSWGKPLSNASEEFALGLVAGGHGDGTIGVWNPLKLIDLSEQDGSVASVAELKKHTGPVRGLEFCGLSPNLLASGADEGELCLWDLAKPSEPSHFPPLKGVGSGAQAEISYLSWNPKFQHILASTSYNGITVVWDLRQQKPLTSFSDSTKRRCSVLQWNPDMSTQFIVASDDDNSPALRLWDVRKTISPVREYVGHTKGVIAMSWCPHDNAYLLTCAKDNRTICWDTFSGEIVCELPASTNWNFDVHWYPKIPGVISASSFDVKIGIYNIEACNRSMAVGGGFGSTARLKSPKWFKRPTGASFGFGGKLVSFQPAQSAPNATASSDVYVRNLVTEQSLVSRSTEFETAIKNGERPSLLALCEKKSEESVSEDEREIWGFLKVMFEEEGTARTKLLAHLGFNVRNEADEIGKTLMDNLSLDELNKGTSLDDGDGTAFSIDNGEEFFNNPQPSEDIPENSDVSNGKQVVDEENEFLESSDSSVDDSIQRALVVGDYKNAVSLCISANRMADALVIANVGGPALWESTRDLYLKKSLSPYSKVVYAMVNNDLMSLVNSRPLSSWKETLALVCTFAQKEEWTILCDTLSSRLMTGGNKLAAILCFICAGNIEKTVEIWSHSLKSESEGRAYVDLLQDLMEKTIILALATGQKRFSPSLSKLVENYAELLASQGLLSVAMEYLKLLGSKESSQELAILQDRITLSAAEPEVSKSVPYESSIANQQPLFGADGATYGHIDCSQTKYQENTQQAPLQQIPSNQYAGGYESSYGSSFGGQQGPQRAQFQDYANPPFQPAPVQMNSYQPAPAQANPSFQPAPAQMNPSFQSAPQLNSSFQPAPTQMFIPSQNVPSQMPSFAPPPTQQGVRTFVPQNPPVLKNAGQYQQPTLGAQLYPGANVYQPAPPAQPSQPVQPRFQPNVTTPPAMSFVPGTGSNFSRPGVSPAQPSSPTQPAQVAAPPPPPTVQTVDTSNVSAELKPVLATLTRLYHETTDALGGPNANLARKREIEDNSRKIGSLFAKLNSGDISPNAASKLIQLCQALDSGDFPTALHIQVVLTTSDWDECNFWLAALKRMIKVRQNARI